MAHYSHAGVSLRTLPIVQHVILACPWIHLIHWNPMEGHICQIFLWYCSIGYSPMYASQKS